MTVGETLTAARSQAGLTVDELSGLTRIREAVIRSIEQDDYEACGGDLYVRGYVRALAGAVGIDAQPLIREYDQVRAGRPGGADQAATMYDLPPVTDDPDATRFDLPPVTDDPDVTRFDLPPVTDPVAAVPPAVVPPAPRGTEDLMAAGYDPPPGGAAPPGPRPAGPRNRRLLAAAAVVLLLILGTILGVTLSSGGATGHPAAAPGAAANAAARAQASAAAKAKASAAAKAGAAAKARAARERAAKIAAGQRAAARRTVILPVATASAYGPDGLADGDNGRVAQWAIAANPPQPWATQWYATPDFGGLKHGSGLLLDLGREATVTSLRADLSRYQGASLELRAGNGAAPPDLRTVATVNDAAGTVALTLSHPVTARYLVIWFTHLPPDGAGHYKETVEHVMVKGRR